MTNRRDRCSGKREVVETIDISVVGFTQIGSPGWVAIVNLYGSMPGQLRGQWKAIGGASLIITVGKDESGTISGALKIEVG